MPFDFIRKEKYTIDYIELFNYLNTYRFLENTNIQRTFLEHWIEALFETENVVEQDISANDIIYQYPIYYGEVEFYLHFDVSVLLSTLVTKNFSQTIPLSTFTKENSNILFSLESSTKSTSSAPIIVQFPRADTDYLVIHGHRELQLVIENSMETIETIFISSKDLIELDIFCSSFDTFYYQFIIELHSIFQKLSQDKFNEIHILKTSYLNQTKYKF